MKKKIIKRTTLIILIVFISISIYLAYDIILFDYFNNKHLEQKKVELVNNYYKNENSFIEFSSFIEEIGNVQNLEFYPPNRIRFSLYSKNHDLNGEVGPWVFEINQDNVELNIDYQFNKGDSIILSYNDTISEIGVWRFFVDTKLSDKRIIPLIEYLNIPAKKLSIIKRGLSNLNCKALTKNNQFIKFRYAGHFGESLDYIIPLRKIEMENEIVKIKDPFHYGITNGYIYCGRTEW